MSPPVIVLMGVTGVGKTTVGALIAEHLGITFVDADDFHDPDIKRACGAASRSTTRIARHGSTSSTRSSASTPSQVLCSHAQR